MSQKATDLAKMIGLVFPKIDYAVSVSLLKKELYFPRTRRKEGAEPHSTKDVTNMMFAVKNIKDWHRENYQRNSKHYSLSARVTKTKLISFIQTQGARVHCNTFAQADTKFKYWVIDYKDLQDDLNYWETLAVSSFMHLPVII